MDGSVFSDAFEACGDALQAANNAANDFGQNLNSWLNSFSNDAPTQATFGDVAQSYANWHSASEVADATCGIADTAAGASTSD